MKFRVERRNGQRKSGERVPRAGWRLEGWFAYLSIRAVSSVMSVANVFCSPSLLRRIGLISRIGADNGSPVDSFFLIYHSLLGIY